MEEAEFVSSVDQRKKRRDERSTRLDALQKKIDAGDMNIDDVLAAPEVEE